MSKLDDNGLWESSRMMLPEHRDRIRQRDQEERNPRRERPALDDQEWAYINELFTMSLNFKEPIKVTIYDPYNPVTLTAVVEDVGNATKRVKLSGEWYQMRDIIGVG